MFKCPSCGYLNDESDVVCMGDGYPIGNEDPDMMRVVEEDDEPDDSVFDEYGEL